MTRQKYVIYERSSVQFLLKVIFFFVLFCFFVSLLSCVIRKNICLGNSEMKSKSNSSDFYLRLINQGEIQAIIIIMIYVG